MSQAATVFTWRAFASHGFDELLVHLGDGWSCRPSADGDAIEVFHVARRIGCLLAVDPDEIVACLGPGESCHFDSDTFDGSCLSLMLEDELFPEDYNPANLAIAADVFRRRAQSSS